MATTTPNFGWPVPTSTDLVKDGATAIEALGDAIDASLVDLEGGTTGQILAKASNTDMDFAWITNDVGDITAVTAGTGISGGGTSGAVTITNSMATEIDAKGDLVAGTGADTFARLAVGTNNQVLIANSAAATGLSWANNGFNYTTWTPTYQGITIGNGTVIARYATSGKMVHAFWSFTLGSTSAITGSPVPSVTLPIASNTINTRGTGAILDSGVAWFNSVADMTDTTKVVLTTIGTASTNGTEEIVTSTNPMVWTTNDKINFSIVYEGV